ncbi:FAD/NAD(P)-binding domain-containing protein [Agrocybe pediades]|nr:FAD/NAD(P)-binding domain-containing protein [Agrocybe pediades]
MDNQAKDTSSFRLGEFCIDEARPMKVVIIGAGYSGIVAGIRFRQKVQNLDLVMYEGHAGVGGTWFANRYPGVQCDIPSHGYQLTFESNTDWSSYYASGQEIQQNLHKLVDTHKLWPYIKLQHRVKCARYNEDTGKWTLTIQRPRNGSRSTAIWRTENLPAEEWEEIHDTADVLFTAVGSLSRWKWPDIPGLESFSGKVVHSAQWSLTDDDLVDKRVGVIGVGSSAIQIVPTIQPKVKHLYNYVRGKTWISTVFLKEVQDLLSGDTSVDNYKFTVQEKEAWTNPQRYGEFRANIEKHMNLMYPATLVGSSFGEAARTAFSETMLQKLAKRPWIAESIIPDFAVACRRLTPGPGYLEALCEDNVTFVSSLIKRITPTGIETNNGESQELDVIVCATGFDTSFKLDFDIIGRNGITIQEHHTPHPRTYLTVAVDGFPNMFQALGPNSNVGSGNLLLIMERQVDYAVQATLKLQRERLKSMDVKKEAVEDYEKYIDAYFPTTVFGQKCRSWYKGGKTDGRVVALYPGSSMHAIRALAHPRWEDFNYEYLHEGNNRFHWLGDGQTVADRDPDADKAWYMRPENIDFPPVPTVQVTSVRAEP